MSKDIKDIEKNVMNQIHEGKLKIRSKVYFIIGSIFTFVGVIASIVVSVFSIGLIKFILRSNGILGHKLDRIISIFPWWFLVFSILGIVIGMTLIRKYDFSYKIDFKIAVILVILVVMISGWLIDALGFNDLLARKGLMRGMMRNIPQERLR